MAYEIHTQEGQSFIHSRIVGSACAWLVIKCRDISTFGQNNSGVRENRKDVICGGLRRKSNIGCANSLAIGVWLGEMARLELHYRILHLVARS